MPSPGECLWVKGWVEGWGGLRLVTVLVFCGLRGAHVLQAACVAVGLPNGNGCLGW